MMTSTQRRRLKMLDSASDTRNSLAHPTKSNQTESVPRIRKEVVLQNTGLDFCTWKGVSAVVIMCKYVTGLNARVYLGRL